MVRDQLGHSSVVTTERSYALLEVETRHGNVYPAQKPAHGDAV
jgi:integrase